MEKTRFTESETVELTSTVTENILKEIIAFGNSDGGTIYIGVEDNGKIIGLGNPDKVSLRISNMVRDSIKPDLTLFVHYQTIVADDKTILDIEIQQGQAAPITWLKRDFVRKAFSCARGFLPFQPAMPSSET